jgi:transcriptional regulator GlxA family with amidase domain
MAAPTEKKTLRIGVLYENTQSSDIVGLDILGNMSTKNVNMVAALEPKASAFLPLSTPMEFLYISSTLEPAWTTPNMFIKPTHTYANAPRDLDIILLGGPDPSAAHEDSLTFLREASKQTKWIMTTCTGGMWLARAGVLDGKKATTNRMFLAGQATQWFPKTEWLDQR